MIDRKMTDKETESFVKPDSEAYKRFKKARRKKSITESFGVFKKVWSAVSHIILWICAVGGFLLSLVQFFKDK